MPRRLAAPSIRADRAVRRLVIVVAMILAAAMSACSSSSQNDILWTFGDESNPVVGDPVQAADGTIYVVVAHYPSPITAPQRDLVALDRGGRALWTLPLSNDYGDTPSITPAGDIWLYSPGRVVRVSPSGRILADARVDIGNGSVGSVGADGTLYVASEGPPPLTHSLFAIEPDGRVRWVKLVEAVTEDEFGCRPRRPAVGLDGAVYSYCDGDPAPWAPIDATMSPCSAVHGGGIARFDPATGEAALLLSVSTRYSCFTDGSIDGAGRVMQYRGFSLIVADPNGPGSVFEYTDQSFLGLIATDGPVWVTGRPTTSGVKILWGQTPVDLTPLNLDQPYPVALAEPDLLLIEYYDEKAQSSVGLIDRQGRLVWSANRILRLALVADGFLLGRRLYASDQLTAVRAPIRGLAKAPWPIRGHDSQNSGRASP
ncbi:MAG TPA: hypothetical protein VGJ84_07025 [Polyangiaceae bacterium]